MNFYNSLKTGINFEKLAKNIFETLGFEVERKEGYNPEYDLVLRKGNKEIMLEIKADLLSEETGNIAIELNQVIKGKREPSGIYTSKADYWGYFYFCEDELRFGIIKLRKLKRMLYKHSNNLRKVKMGDKEAIEYLVPVDTFESWLDNIVSVENGGVYYGKS